MRIKFQFCKMKEVLEMDGAAGCTILLMCLIPLYTQKWVRWQILCLLYHNKKMEKFFLKNKKKGMSETERCHVYF